MLTYYVENPINPRSLYSCDMNTGLVNLIERDGGGGEATLSSVETINIPSSTLASIQIPVTLIRGSPSTNR